MSLGAMHVLLKEDWSWVYLDADCPALTKPSSHFPPTSLCPGSELLLSHPQTTFLSPTSKYFWLLPIVTETISHGAQEESPYGSSIEWFHLAPFFTIIIRISIIIVGEGEEGSVWVTSDDARGLHLVELLNPVSQIHLVKFLVLSLRPIIESTVVVSKYRYHEIDCLTILSSC